MATSSEANPSTSVLPFVSASTTVPLGRVASMAIYNRLSRTGRRGDGDVDAATDGVDPFSEGR